MNSDVVAALLFQEFINSLGPHLTNNPVQDMWARTKENMYWKPLSDENSLIAGYFKSVSLTNIVLDKFC